MKQLLFLPLFFLFASGVASAQVRKLPTIDCENDAKLELYLQLIAEDIYGQKYGCDTPFPMRKERWDLQAFTLAGAVSEFCAFDLLSAKELWQPIGYYADNFGFAKPTTIRDLVAELQGFDVSDVRCDMNRSLVR